MTTDPKKITRQTQYDPSRRAFLRNGLISTSGYLGLGAVGTAETDIDYEIIEQTIHIPNLPSEFIGFTIGLVSDIHSGILMSKEDMDDYVQILNDLKSDLIVLPGDFVSSKTEEVYPFIEAFSGLRAPYGVYGCLGNHDYFADVDIIAKQIDACGIKLLRNDAVVITKGAASMNLIGVDDIGWRADPHEYLDRALVSVPVEGLKILLCHKPYYLELAAQKKISLTLSGHTHGGQIVFAKIGDTYIAPASLVSKYVAGLYMIDHTKMYITRGIGTVFIPFRFNCPPEITKIILQ